MKYVSPITRDLIAVGLLSVLTAISCAKVRSIGEVNSRSLTARALVSSILTTKVARLARARMAHARMATYDDFRAPDCEIPEELVPLKARCLTGRKYHTFIFGKRDGGTELTPTYKIGCPQQGGGSLIYEVTNLEARVHVDFSALRITEHNSDNEFVHTKGEVVATFDVSEGTKVKPPEATELSPLECSYKTVSDYDSGAGTFAYNRAELAEWNYACVQDKDSADEATASIEDVDTAFKAEQDEDYRFGPCELIIE